MGSLFKSNASTSQSTAQTTTQTDNRIAAGDASTVLSNANGNSIATYNTTTDFGAVQGSMAIIASGQREQSQNLNKLIDAGENIFTNGIGFAEHVTQGVLSNSRDMMRTQEQMLTSTANQIQNAYQSSANVQANATAAIKDAFTTAKAGEQKILVGAALAMVAVVALRKG